MFLVGCGLYILVFWTIFGWFSACGWWFFCSFGACMLLICYCSWTEYCPVSNSKNVSCTKSVSKFSQTKHFHLDSYQKFQNLKPNAFDLPCSPVLEYESLCNSFCLVNFQSDDMFFYITKHISENKIKICGDLLRSQAGGHVSILIFLNI